MAKNVNHIQHLKSSVVNEINGVKSPKLPNPSALTEGEIAVNFADGYETLSIKSSSGNIATFSSDSKFYTKSEIDDAEQVTAQAINDLNTRVDAVSGNSHSHTNKDVLDGITAQKVSNWDAAYTSAHIHTNQSVLDNITSQNVSDWDTVTAKTDTTAFTAHISDSGLTTIHHTHDNMQYLSGISGDVGTMAYEDASDYYTKEEIDEGDRVISQSLNDLNVRVIANTDSISGLTERLESFIEPLTWSELKAKRDNGTLFVGGYYRITDFVTTTAQDNTQSANHAFDIIVRADDTDVLNENAYAIQHSGDTYFSASTLEAWELKYCIDNDTTRFAWADDTNGKGVIYYMKDEFENECPYDFKNIQFPRYKITECTKSPDLVDQYSVDGLSDITVDTATTYWCYTFSMIDFNNDNLAHDVSVEQNKYLGDEGFCYKQQNNIIKEYYDTFYGDTNINYLFLPDNVFVTDTDICSIEEGYGEFYGFYNNLLENNNHHNTFGNYFYSNSFGNSCYYNTFGNGCESNTFGNSCYYNTFGNDCYYNTFGNYFQYNSFGNSCYYNTFGNECYSNTFGNDCYYNTFGNSCGRNSFGNYCRYNTFGNECYSNTFGNNCYSNSFGNSCNNITFAKDYMYYNIVENGNQYITVTSTQTTSSSNVIRNFTIAQGVNNSTTSKTISHDTVNDTFKTTYQNGKSTIVNVQ